MVSTNALEHEHEDEHEDEAPCEGGRVPDIIPKDNIRRKQLDGVSEAHETLPDRKFAVMLGLIGNVGGNSLYVRLAH